MNTLLQDAHALFDSAVARADPAQSLRQTLQSAPLVPRSHGGRDYLLALGKAAVPMMQEMLDHIPEPRQALVVTNPENLEELPGVRVLAGSHPVPDQASADAGAAAIDFLSQATEQDRVTVLVSGGGSALMVAPAAGLSLSDKAAVNAALLASGLEINEMNLVRQQLSDLKGGGLLRHAAPASVQAYLLSDVIGDDLRAIASGPTVSPLGDKTTARDTLQRAGIWDDLPASVRTHLTATAVETPLPEAQNTLIGSNRHSLVAMMEQAATLGWQPQLVSDHLVGDVADAVEEVLHAAKAAPLDQPVALIFGGETTVRLQGDGRGGRNQELALRMAQRGAAELSGDWLFLSGGTDGRDGPTDAAGGIATPETWTDIAKAGADPSALLANNDSYAALKAANALLVCGGTGTNVADVQVFLRRAR
ncbi:MAG: glycerate kinase [Roseobacter sp. MedPE-SW]|nr:MAG: glycerate kinase [Roseobacter sp. MedPE-SW]